MTNRTIKHEVKLQKSVIVILAVLAIGVCANAFAPAFSVTEAMEDTGWLRNINSAIGDVAVSIGNIAACRM